MGLDEFETHPALALGKERNATEIIGTDPSRLRGFFDGLFGWEFDTSGTGADEISEPNNYGFVDRLTTSDGTGIRGGIGGGEGCGRHTMFYVGVADVEKALQKAESLGERPTGSRSWWVGKRRRVAASVESGREPNERTEIRSSSSTTSSSGATPHWT